MEQANFYPRNIMTRASFSLASGLCNEVREALCEIKFKHGFRVFVVGQDRGRCYNRKVITIPLWVCTKEMQDKRQWYVAHEIAHAFNLVDYGLNAWAKHSPNKVEQHGAEFMNELKRICPAQYLHFETNYKPRNAASAGISKDSMMNKIMSGKYVPDDF